MLENEMKAALKKYGIFLGILAGMTALVLCSVLLARGSWRRGLALAVQETLDAHYPDTYAVGSFMDISAPIATSAAVFSVRPRRANTTELSAYCVIVRMPTLAGAAPALFLYSPRAGAQFVGYALDPGKAAHVMNATVQRSMIAYWQKQVPLILGKAGVR